MFSEGKSGRTSGGQVENGNETTESHDDSVVLLIAGFIILFFRQKVV